MWEKLGGLAAIAIAVTVLSVISVFEPPTYIQILCGIGGSVVCLFGIVFLFAQGQIFTKDRNVKKTPEAG